MSNHVRNCRTSKATELTCFGEEKVRFNNWFSASSQGKTSDIKGQIVDEKRGHSKKRIASSIATLTLKKLC